MLTLVFKSVSVIYLLALGTIAGFAPPPLVIEPGEDKRSGPGRRYGHELVYDEAHDEIVLFGGFGSNGLSIL